MQALSGALGAALFLGGSNPQPAEALQTVMYKASYPEALATILVSRKILQPVYR